MTRVRKQAESLVAPIRRWWEGDLYENEPGALVVFIGGVRRHWTARACRAIWEYARENHRWLIGTGIAIVGLIIAARRYG
jgi:hypothetical protein